MTERDMTDAALAAERDLADLRITVLEDENTELQEEVEALKADIVRLQARITELRMKGV